MGRIPDNPPMKDIRRSALVAFPAPRVYGVIADVESYPLFLPWCTHARIDERRDDEVVATVGIKRGPLGGEFTTRNTLVPGRSIAMQLVRGPFSTLEGVWTVEPLGDSGCRVELALRFEFASRLSGAVFGPVFEEVAVSLVDAFVRRARDVGPA